jgi:hypothetical protein
LTQPELFPGQQYAPAPTAPSSGLRPGPVSFQQPPPATPPYKQMELPFGKGYARTPPSPAKAGLRAGLKAFGKNPVPYLKRAVKGAAKGTAKAAFRSPYLLLQAAVAGMEYADDLLRLQARSKDDAAVQRAIAVYHVPAKQLMEQVQAMPEAERAKFNALVQERLMQQKHHKTGNPIFDAKQTFMVLRSALAASQGKVDTEADNALKLMQQDNAVGRESIGKTAEQEYSDSAGGTFLGTLTGRTTKADWEKHGLGWASPMGEAARIALDPGGAALQGLRRVNDALQGRPARPEDLVPYGEAPYAKADPTSGTFGQDTFEPQSFIARTQESLHRIAQDEQGRPSVQLFGGVVPRGPDTGIKKAPSANELGQEETPVAPTGDPSSDSALQQAPKAPVEMSMEEYVKMGMRAAGYDLDAAAKAQPGGWESFVPGAAGAEQFNPAYGGERMQASDVAAFNAGATVEEKRRRSAAIMERGDRLRRERLNYLGTLQKNWADAQTAKSVERVGLAQAPYMAGGRSGGNAVALKLMDNAARAFASEMTAINAQAKAAITPAQRAAVQQAMDAARVRYQEAQQDIEARYPQSGQGTPLGAAPEEPGQLPSKWVDAAGATPPGSQPPAALKQQPTPAPMQRPPPAPMQQPTPAQATGQPVAAVPPRPATPRPATGPTGTVEFRPGVWGTPTPPTDAEKLVSSAQPGVQKKLAESEELLRRMQRSRGLI